MATRLAALLLTLGLIDPAGAAEPASLDALVEQLGNRDFKKREAATRQLDAAGPLALPALRKALTHSDPEVRRRAAEMVPALETAALLAPRTVTLKMERKTIREVLDELTRQTGYKIEHWSNNAAQTYSFQLNATPFWEALDRINRDAGLVLQPGYGDDRIRLHQQEAVAPFVRYDGPFRFVANGFQHYRNIDFSLIGKGAGPSRRSETLTFTFSVYVEPRLPLLGMGEPKLTAAYDSERNSMLPPLGQNAEAVEALGMRGGRWVSRYGNGYRSLHVQSQVNLNRPSEKASSVRLIRGTVPVTLLAEQKQVVLTDAILSAKGKRFTCGPTSFLIEEFSPQANKQYRLKMTVTEDNKENPNDYTWANSLYQRIELLDARGNKYQVFGSNWENSGANHAQMTLTYGPQGDAGPPAKFVYYSWTTLQHQVAFEFRDLPMP